MSMQIAMAKTLLRQIMATGGPMQPAQILFCALMKKLALKEMKQLLWQIVRRATEESCVLIVMIDTLEMVHFNAENVRH